jgi:hypothetical protein
LCTFTPEYVVDGRLFLSKAGDIKSEKGVGWQGDQIGRIFAYRRLIILVSYLKFREEPAF